MEKEAMVFDIQHASVVDGPGLRTTVFFKGCNLRCKWCHNPESQKQEPQMMFHKEKCIGCGRCRNHAPDDLDFVCYQDARERCGFEYTTEEIFEKVQKDKKFYENSGGGVTCSGGECMLQIDFLRDFLKKCKNEGIHTAVDTAGNVDWSCFEQILPVTDLFLYDLKAVTEKLHIEGTGVSNQRILENLRRLSEVAEKGKTKIWIRIPVIGGYNDTLEEMEKITDFLEPLCIEKIELLSYHGMAKNKYEALGMKFTEYQKPDEEFLNTCRKRFSNIVSLFYKCAT